ncbi:MAG: penicillin-binding transpeptidase domain-containing protein [Armatimonadota bacterium]
MAVTARPPRNAYRSPAASRQSRAKVAAPSERVLRVAILVVLLYAALAIRCFYLQIIRNQEFQEQARAIREKALPLPAQRGVIFDRNGTLLVSNEPAYDIILDPNMWHASTNAQIGDTAAARQEAALVGLEMCLPGVDVRGEFAKKPPKLVGSGAKGKPRRYRTITIARQVSVETGERVKAMTLIGVGTPGTFRRKAVDGNLASHVLGFTGREGNGLDGLELKLNTALKGEVGTLWAEFDTRGREIPGTERSRQPALQGQDTVLTIDADLQHSVQQSLAAACTKSKAEGGTAIVMDPKTGDILALANYPTYNVNDRSGTDLAARMNRAVTAPYEPGSTLKVITAAAALEEQKVSTTTNFYCPGRMKIGRRSIGCAHGSKHGNESLDDVIKNSCNIATAQMGFKLGSETLHHYERLFGFGDKTGSGLPGESRGMLTSAENWSDIQLANVAFGQGISVTPLQIAAAYAAIANDGVYLQPRIVRGTRNADTESMTVNPVDQGRRVVSPQTALEVRRMLQSVIDSGTGNLSQLDGYTAGGKTGTAQIAENGRYGGKFVASFIGMAPMNAPKFVILVAITAPQGGHYGGVVAGPVFKEIAQKALLSHRVPHDKPETPAEIRRRKRREETMDVAEA